MLTSLPPFAILIAGAVLVGFLKGRVRGIAMLLIPVLGLINLLGYEVEDTDQDTCTIRMTVRCNGGTESVAYEAIPRPNAEGSFTVGGTERAVIFTADRPNLELAEVKGST